MTLAQARRLAPWLLIAAVGCDAPGGDRAASSAGGSMPPPPPTLAEMQAAAEAPPPAQPGQQGQEEVKLRRVIGETTTDIRDFDQEMQRGDAQVATGQITARDPITLPGNAYVSIIGRASILQIEHALNLYNALNDRYPADTDEFMSEVVHANNIQLPQLPAYQEYAYDSQNHRLVVLEYPDRKEQLLEQVRGNR